MTFDETIAALDALHAAQRAESARWRSQLEARVAGLSAPIGDGSTDEGEPIAERHGRSGTPARESSPEPGPSVTLPRRRTHGGNYGPKVRDKLIREALGR